MEIKKYTDIRPVLATEDIPEGRMVLITTHSETDGFGGWTDLPGIKLPANSTEALRARYVASYALTNSSTPFYVPTPSMDFALRGGFDQPANVPFSAAVHLTPPENKKTGVIPADGPARAFGQGEFVVYSGEFVADAGLVPGAYLEALNTADDTEAQAGKLSLTSDVSLKVAEVVEYDAAKFELWFRTFNP